MSAAATNGSSASTGALSSRNASMPASSTACRASTLSPSGTVPQRPVPGAYRRVTSTTRKPNEITAETTSGSRSRRAPAASTVESSEAPIRGITAWPSAKTRMKPIAADGTSSAAAISRRSGGPSASFGVPTAISPRGVRAVGRAVGGRVVVAVMMSPARHRPRPLRSRRSRRGRGSRWSGGRRRRQTGVRPPDKPPAGRRRRPGGPDLPRR